MMYRKLLRPLLFRLPTETVHRFALGLLRIFGGNRLGEWLLARIYRYDSPLLEREVFGIKFPNPIGVAAGYDTDARYYRQLRAMGFGFVEAGTITPRSQPGNVRPRVFRLADDQAIINRAGQPNSGMDITLDNLRKRGRQRYVVVGANIAANTLSQEEALAMDYLKLFRNLYQYVDYFVINVTCSCKASEKLQSKEGINEILEGLFEFRRGQSQYRPILLKISPDWDLKKVDDAVDILVGTPLDGLVIGGTTSSREGLKTPDSLLSQIGNGGLSGAPLLERSIELIRYAGDKMEWRYPIIGSGGVMTPQDAERMLDAGASLVEIYTGLTYSGPKLPKRICKYLEKKEIARNPDNTGDIIEKEKTKE